jgi:hypothetical protein
MFVALMLRFPDAGVRLSAKVFETLPALAVSVTVWAELNEDTVAAKDALVAPAGTVAALGTVTVLLLLDRLTLNPPVGAAALRVVVQVTLPEVVIEELLQEKEFSAGAAAPVPMPKRLTVVLGLDEELLETVNWPLTGPAADGLNCNCNASV